MLEPPALAEHDLAAALAANYGLAVRALTFLPIGADALAWAYRVDCADGTANFLKVRRGAPRAAALAIPRFLRDKYDLPTIAPLPTRAGALFAPLSEYVLVVYPFIEGRTATEAGLTEAQWTEVGSAFRRLHTAALPPDLARLLRRETFVPEWGSVVAALDVHLSRQDLDDSEHPDLAGFWQAHRSEILRLTEHAHRLGQQLQAAAPKLVLCHADAHTWNVLVEPDGRWWLVDWDEVVLASPERDLMFFISGISAALVSPRQTELFLQGYGSAAVDPLGLAFYRHAWAVNDIGAFGEQVCWRPDTGLETRRAALASFKHLFQPGEIVALAFASNGLEHAVSGEPGPPAPLSRD